jgi:PAS domain S-box-containing protein
MRFERPYNKYGSERPLAYLIGILHSSTEYSLIGTDLAGTIRIWNEGARRLYGYDADEIVDKNKSEVLHSPEDIQACLPAAMREEALRSGRWEGSVSWVRKDARRFKANSMLTPLLDAAGRHDSYLLISKEVTLEIPSARVEEKLRGLLESASRRDCDRQPRRAGFCPRQSSNQLVMSILAPSGLKVLIANDVSQGLALARQSSCGSNVSDVCTGEGGYNLHIAVRSDPKHWSIPFFLIASTRMGESDRERGLALGADGFLRRRIEPHVLLDEISECLREKGRY